MRREERRMGMYVMPHPITSTPPWPLHSQPVLLGHSSCSQILTARACSQPNYRQTIASYLRGVQP